MLKKEEPNNDIQIDKPEKAWWYIEFTEQWIFTKRSRYVYIWQWEVMPTQAIISKKLSELATFKRNELRSSELWFRLLYIPALDLDKTYNDTVTKIPWDRVRIRMN